MLTTSLWVALAATAIAAKDIKPGLGADIKLRGVHPNGIAQSGSELTTRSPQIHTVRG
jgi:hypothetical protein